VLRDRKPLKRWSQGRVTLAGDAAHATSPYAAYGAGMAIEDGYETPRRPHTARQTQQAWILGKVFHHAPAPLRPGRDLILDHTPLLQKVVGESSPKEIISQLDDITQAEKTFHASLPR
jgi:2-polyprenyl-6-methoxyphenol hydroxylase-like FAD-dependent oxidoreductase